MSAFLRHLFTGKDGVTFDLGRVLWLKMAVAFVAFSGWTVTHGATFSPTDWAAGAGLILAAGGGALKIKETTEP